MWVIAVAVFRHTRHRTYVDAPSFHTESRTNSSHGHPLRRRGPGCFPSGFPAQLCGRNGQQELRMRQAPDSGTHERHGFSRLHRHPGGEPNASGADAGGILAAY